MFRMHFGQRHHDHGHHPHHHFGPRGWGGAFEAAFDMAREGHGGRGRRGRMFDGAQLRLLLLKLIADAPRHGYDLIREIEDLTGGAYAPSPGVVYPTLTLLEDMGHIEEHKAEGAKKQFAATEAGLAHLEERAEEVAALLARLRDMAEAYARADTSSVRRALHNLRAVLTNKLGGHRHDEATSEATVHEIVAMIDDLARKIERL